MTIISEITISDGTYSNFRRKFPGAKVTLTGNITFTSNTTIYAPNANVDCSTANITVTAPSSGTRTLAIISGEYIRINIISAPNCEVAILSHKTVTTNTVGQVSTSNTSVACSNLTLYMALGSSNPEAYTPPVRFAANTIILRSFAGTIFEGSDNLGRKNWRNVSSGITYDFATYNLDSGDPNYSSTITRILESQTSINARFSGYISAATTFYAPLSLSAVQTEFGGTNPVGLSEYYAGGGLVPPGTTSGNVGYPTPTSTPIPSSGAISFTNFYGATKV